MTEFHSTREGPLIALLREIECRYGAEVRGEVHSDSLVLCFERSGAVVGVTVDDASRPSFSVSYPAFDEGAASWRELRERTAKGVLREGVMSLVRAVERDGAALPELANPRLRRR